MSGLHDQDSVEVSLAALVVLRGIVGFGPSEEKFDLEGVLSGERLCLVLEAIDDVEGARGIVNGLLVLQFHHVDN